MWSNLTSENEQIITEKDSVVIINNYESKRGGATLDVTGFAPEVIRAGHPVIRETATGNYKPMPVNGGQTAYAALPAGHTYFGIVLASVPTKRPQIGIMLRGSVNVVAAPYDLATISAAITTANPHLVFRQD